MNKLCSIGIILLISNVLFIIIKSNNISKEFKNSLNKEQMHKYKGIIYNRLYIYILGTIIGFIVAYLFIHFNNGDYKLCKFIGIICIIKLVFYYIYPKKPLMLYNLDNQYQVNLWADVYTNFKTSWIYSIIVSIIAYALFYYGFVNI